MKEKRTHETAEGLAAFASSLLNTKSEGDPILPRLKKKKKVVVESIPEPILSKTEKGLLFAKGHILPIHESEDHPEIQIEKEYKRIATEAIVQLLNAIAVQKKKMEAPERTEVFQNLPSASQPNRQVTNEMLNKQVIKNK